jgi:hypothetical protein
MKRSGTLAYVQKGANCGSRSLILMNSVWTLWTMAGLDPVVADRGKEGHFGLQGMRERAARIAGKLTVSSSPESGTHVKLVVPGKIIYRKATSDSH